MGCPAISTGVPSITRAAWVAGAAGVGDGAAAYADVDRATAERVFAVAADDQREIDKLKVLQAYVCAVRSDVPGCGDR
jgi:hypothetical protein